MELQRTYLIQRLTAPHGGINPFAFGDGKPNGGLSQEAAVALADICAFDSMGASEYEWGAVPEAVQVLEEAVSKGKLIQHRVTVVMPTASAQDSTSEDSGAVTIHIVCPKGQEKEISNRILYWARTEMFERTVHMRPRDWEMLDKAVQNPEKSRIQGWLALEDDPFFFCLPQVMADNFFGYCNQKVPV